MLGFLCGFVVILEIGVLVLIVVCALTSGLLFVWLVFVYIWGFLIFCAFFIFWFPCVLICSDLFLITVVAVLRLYFGVVTSFVYLCGVVISQVFEVLDILVFLVFGFSLHFGIFLVF